MERLKNILHFSDAYPMIFTGLDFWIFFIFVYTLFAFIHRKIAIRNFYLLAVSWFFYYKTSGLFILLLVFSSLSSFGAGYLIYHLETQIQRKFFLVLSIATQLLILAYFKYAYFIVQSFNSFFGVDFALINHFAFAVNHIVNEQVFTIEKIILPVGISFFTFQCITYITDIYREKLKPTESFIDYAFYISFFPQLVAGPIVRAADFIPQIRLPFRLSHAEFGAAIFIILKGLFKKIVIGDYMAVNFIDRVFDNPLAYTGIENITALTAYSLQVYVDFSGYTDIAIGLSLLMGFRINKNFNSPYKALNVADFWRRWHISLSQFLKDYLYIPLGGNKHGNWRTHINLMITMLLGGLWHGASWNFVIWGGINGIGLLVYKLWKKISPYEKLNSIPIVIWKIFLTFTFITFTRIFFRAPDMETVHQFFHQIRYNLGWEVFPIFISGFYKVMLIMLLGFITHWLSNDIKMKWQNKFADSTMPIQIAISALVIFIIYQSLTSSLQPFIYFQF